MLGVMYAQGIGVPQDDKQAMKWYRVAAEQGFDKAQFHLGAMYDKGTGAPEDDKEAIKWFRLAAEQGHATKTGFLEPSGSRLTACRSVIWLDIVLLLIIEILAASSA